MTSFTPAYRLTVYAPRSVDATETTVLTGNGVIHADPFQVTTLSGVVGWQPYLGWPQIRRGRADFLARKTDIGQVTVQLLDARMTAGGSNLLAWVTGFLSGSATGRLQLLGNRVALEESLDGGATWAAAFTGRIVRLALDGPRQYALTVQGMTRDLTTAAVFVGRPDASVSYAAQPGLLPVGPTADFGLLRAPTPLLGSTDDGSQSQIFSNFGYTGGPFNRVLLEVPGGDWNIVTAGLLGGASIGVQAGSAGANPENPTYAAGGSFFTPGNTLRARITFLGGGTGEFLVYAVGIIPATHGKWAVSELVIGALPATDPAYLALPGVATDITALTILGPTGALTDDTPLLLADQHPVQVLADLLDGRFGYLTSAGAPTRTYPRNAAAFTALLADPSFGVARFVLTKSDTLLAWVEKNLCQPFGLVLTENAAGEIVPVDVRLPQSLAGLATIVDDDLAGATEPQWTADATAAIAVFKVKTYVDRPLDADDLWTSADTYPAAPASRVVTSPAEFDVAFFGPGDAIDKTQTVDAQGLRTMPNELLQGTLRADWVGAQAMTLADSYRRPYATGPLTITLTCRRTATVTGLTPGGWALLQVSKIPDPRTNARGGTRLVRVLEVSAQAATVQVTLLDAGPNQAAAAPSLGTLTAGPDAGSQTVVPVTCNPNGDPVVVQYAITPAGTGSAPAATDAAWLFGARVTASGSVTIGHQAAGCRCWYRARSEPAPTAYDTGYPSAWVTAATAYRDTTAITAPTGLAVSAVSGKAATLTWSVGSDTRHLVRVLLASGASQAAADAATPVKLIDLPAGTTQYPLWGLTSGQWYHAAVQFLDGVGGASPTAGTTPTSFQATGTNVLMRVPAGLAAVPIRSMFTVAGAAANAATPDDRLATGYAINALPGDLGDDLVVWEAPDVSGAPGTFVEVMTLPAARLRETGVVVTRHHPATGTPLWVTLSARSARGDDSATLPPLQVTPGILPRVGLAAASAAPLRRDRGLAGGRRTVSQLQSWLVPNGEFDLWETPSQPHAWALDLSAGAVVTQDSTGLASGDYALQWACPTLAANTGYHGISTNDPVAGAFCLPLRPGLKYRVLIVAKVSRVAEGQSMRLTLDFGAGGTLQQEWTFTSAGDYDRYEFVPIEVPTTADPNTKATLEFSGHGYSGGTVTFTLDSLRFDEETTDYEALARREQYGSYLFSVNGDFEDGLRFWERRYNICALSIDESTVYKGTKSLLITAKGTFQDPVVAQSVRNSDADVFSIVDGTRRAIRVRQGDLIRCVGTFRYHVHSGSIGAQVNFGVQGFAGSSPTGGGTNYVIAQQPGGPYTMDTWTELSGWWIVPAGVDWVVPAIWAVTMQTYDQLWVDELSLVRMVAPVAAKVNLAGAAQAISNAIETAISWDTEEYDRGGFWSNAHPTRFTFPGGGAQKFDGIYRLEAQVSFASNTAGRRKVRFRKNGGSYVAAKTDVPVNGEDHIIQIHADLCDPAPGDYYELYAYQNSGRVLNVQKTAAGDLATTWMALHQVK